MATSSSTSRCGTRLSYIPMEELAAIGVEVERLSITTSVSPTPMERGIDDPESIIPLVHIRKNKDITVTVRGIFDRDDIRVNPEEECLLAETDRPESYSHESTAHCNYRCDSPKKRSESRSRSRSSERSKRKIYRESARESDEKNRRSSQKEWDKFSVRENERNIDRQCKGHIPEEADHSPGKQAGLERDLLTMTEPEI